MFDEPVIELRKCALSQRSPFASPFVLRCEEIATWTVWTESLVWYFCHQHLPDWAVDIEHHPEGILATQGMRVVRENPPP